MHSGPGWLPSMKHIEDKAKPTKEEQNQGSGLLPAGSEMFWKIWKGQQAGGLGRAVTNSR